jgi:hypothetical protein
MSIFLPYSVEQVVTYFTTLYNLDLSTLTSYQTLILNILANAYFFLYWFFIIYFSIKLFNRVWERIF